MTSRTKNYTDAPCLYEGCDEARHINSSGFQIGYCLEHNRLIQRGYYHASQDRKRAALAVVPVAPSTPAKRPYHRKPAPSRAEVERMRIASALVEMTAHVDGMRTVLAGSSLRAKISLETPGAIVHMAVEGVEDGQ